MRRDYFIRFDRNVKAYLLVFGFAMSGSSFFAGLAFSQQSKSNEQNAQPQLIWPEFAPGETVKSLGEQLPTKETDVPTITRIEKIRTPSLDLFIPSSPNGTGILILPGGGFGKVVPDLEGSEAAVWLNHLGIAAFVLRYRTNESKPTDEPSYLRPLQDAERAVRWVRSKADTWKLDANRIGVLGFSAGGQVASILHTASKASYEPIDQIDVLSFRPDFSLLVYPWNVWDVKNESLMPELQFSKNLPPAFIVHTSDDRSSAVGAAMIYAGLKKHEVPAELHIYENGGHGYGTRARPDSNIGTWTERATDWLVSRKLAK